MQAYSLLKEMLALFGEALPQAVFREGWGPQAAGRLPQKPVVAGQVGSESSEGEEWNARLDFTLILPRGSAPGVGEALLAAMAGEARENFPALAGVERGAFAPDGTTGLLAAVCSFRFAGGGGGGVQQVTIGGVARYASGWEVEVDPGRTLTAIGEDEPFASVGGVSYTVKVEGIDTKGLERLAGFTAVLGGQAYLRCRWKSLDEAGKSAVFVSYKREERGA